MRNIGGKIEIGFSVFCLVLFAMTAVGAFLAYPLWGLGVVGLVGVILSWFFVLSLVRENRFLKLLKARDRLRPWELVKEHVNNKGTFILHKKLPSLEIGEIWWTEEEINESDYPSKDSFFKKIRSDCMDIDTGKASLIVLPQEELEGIVGVLRDSSNKLIC